MEVKADRLMTVVPARVMRALTDPAELLLWCCEEPAVSGDTYRLSGRSVVLGAQGGRLLERNDELLRFEWIISGTATVVEIALEGEKQTGGIPATYTRVRITHTGIPQGALPGAMFEESWECIWILFLRNLRSWVERGEAPGRYDFTAPTLPAVERHLVMSAPAGQVWRAIINPELRKRWLNDVEMGEVLAMEEGRYVKFDWPQWGPSQVEWTVEPLSDGRCMVTVREEKAVSAFDHHLGWHDFLVALYQETQVPLIRRTEWINASPQRVWRYMASQEGMRGWFNPGMEFEPRPGGHVRFEAHGGVLSGEVVVFEPGKKLAFTWLDHDEGWTEPMLLLTLELTVENGGTRVMLTHSGFEKVPGSLNGYQRGWSSTTSLGKLKHLVEGEENVA